jgi:penicillin-binding protein 2
MREVVLSGTATSLRSALLEIAGKSGSPKYGSGSEERYNAIFGAYAPYEDPEIVILIVVENPTSNTGSTLPVIKDVINWYATNRYQQEKEGLNVDE